MVRGAGVQQRAADPGRGHADAQAPDLPHLLPALDHAHHRSGRTAARFRSGADGAGVVRELGLRGERPHVSSSSGTTTTPRQAGEEEDHRPRARLPRHRGVVGSLTGLPAMHKGFDLPIPTANTGYAPPTRTWRCACSDIRTCATTSRPGRSGGTARSVRSSCTGGIESTTIAQIGAVPGPDAGDAPVPARMCPDPGQGQGGLAQRSPTTPQLPEAMNLVHPSQPAGTDWDPGQYHRFTITGCVPPSTSWPASRLRRVSRLRPRMRLGQRHARDRRAIRRGPGGRHRHVERDARQGGRDAGTKPLLLTDSRPQPGIGEKMAARVEFRPGDPIGYVPRRAGRTRPPAGRPTARRGIRGAPSRTPAPRSLNPRVDDREHRDVPPLRLRGDRPPHRTRLPARVHCASGCESREDVRLTLVMPLV